jgi:hypothetical protein
MRTDPHEWPCDEFRFVAIRVPPGGCGWQRTLRLLLAALAVQFGSLMLATGSVLATPTTARTGATHVYDALAVTRVEAHRLGVAAASSPSLGGALAPSSWRAVEARDVCTTPSISVVATNTASSSIDDLLQPGGSLIGKAGTDVSIREITGGLPDAQAMFQQLSRGGTIVEQTVTLTRVQLPNGGFVQLRTVMARSPATAATIDVNIPGLDITKLKFNP